MRTNKQLSSGFSVRRRDGSLTALLLTIVYSALLAAYGQTPDLRAYLLALHVHGVDYNVVAGYSGTNIDWIREGLNDDKLSEFHGNLAIALGILGEASDASIVLQRFRAGTSRLPQGSYSSKQACLLALGYLANRTKATPPLDYLSAALAPQFWSQTEKLNWLPPGTTSELRRNIELSAAAALALALTGSDQAAARLEAAEADIQQLDRAEERSLLNAIKQAKLEALKVRQFGLSNYHRR